jgi:hypothetical protein
MADIPESKIKANVELPYVSINVNGTDYKVSAFLFNNRGEVKFADSNTFNKIVFESTHNTPFLLGSFYINDNENSNTLSKVDLGKVTGSISELNSYGDGQEFLRIKIAAKAAEKVACNYTDEVILDKIFIVTDKQNTVKENQKLAIYHFIDNVYWHLANKLIPWSSDRLKDDPDQNTQTHRKSTKVNSGRALKDLLTTFTDDVDIIDEENWDDGIGSVYYTLPAGENALKAIQQIMKTYVSTDESGGILTHYNGQFQLQSIRSSVNKLYSQTDKSKWNGLQALVGTSNLGNNFAGGVKIQTNDNRQNYTNKEAGNVLGRHFNYIPVDINNIQFTEAHPRATFNELTKKEITQFNSKSKQWIIHSDKGTLPAVEKISSLGSLPDGNDNKLNIDVNEEFSNVKDRLFVLDDDNSAMYRGTIKLQKQLLDSLTKARFNCVGNIDLSSNKFIYMNIDLNNKNKFAEKIPGFWYITKNITTIGTNQYTSTVDCVKLDKPK